MEQIKKTCYMCDAEGISREHVPPLCLFPEAKDVKGLNFRKDLITVPSCELHNSKKSHDDEFLMVSIAGIIGNNQLGYLQTISKVNRALKRKSIDFLGKVVLKNQKATSIRTNEGYEFPVLYGNPDHNRLLNCFEHIVKGLYMFEHGHRFHGRVKMLLGFVSHSKKDDQTFLELIRRRFDLEDLRLEIKGNNPGIFTYQFCLPDNGVIAFKLVFYGGTEVFGALIPEGTKKPYDLAHQIMSNGMPVTFTLGKEEFQFNQNEDSINNFYNK